MYACLALHFIRTFVSLYNGVSGNMYILSRMLKSSIDKMLFASSKELDSNFLLRGTASLKRVIHLSFHVSMFLCHTCTNM